MADHKLTTLKLATTPTMPPPTPHVEIGAPVSMSPPIPECAARSGREIVGSEPNAKYSSAAVRAIRAGRIS